MFEALPHLRDYLRVPFVTVFGEERFLSLEELIAHYGRLRTNQFGLDDSGSAVFVRSSFFNHSCAPNLTYFERSGHEMVFWAKDDIPAGTPLSIHYISLTLTVDERRRKLQRTWMFQCACEVCEHQLEQQRASSDSEVPDALNPGGGAAAAAVAAAAAAGGGDATTEGVHDSTVK